MDKETLSNYGWIVVLVLILAVMLALATPFGTFIAGAIKSTTAGLFSVNQAALGSAGIDVNDMVFENCDHVETEIRNATDTYTGDTCCKACGTVLQAGQTVRAKVPEGGKYTAADGTVYNPGDEFPETVTTGDIYRLSNYEYRYNQYYNVSWQTDASQNGWGVKYHGGESAPGPILAQINGEPITTMHSTFKMCSAMITAPEIPSSVTNLDGAFMSCTNLVSPPIIPDNVTNMHETFYGCHKLTSAPAIPSGVISMTNGFRACTSLVDISKVVIPSGVTSLRYTFYGCSALKDISSLVIPSTVTSLNETFRGCTSMTVAPDMSKASGVEDATYAFQDCQSLINAPDLRNCTSLWGMGAMFKGCTSLVTAPTLPANVKNMMETFSGCTSLADVSNLIIPSNVFAITQCFQNCTSLTGTITINSTLSNNYASCFAGVDFEAQKVKLAGSSSILDTIGATGTNYCAECNGCCKGGH